MSQNKIPMNIRLHPDTAKDLKSCAELKRIDKTAIVELALNEYFLRNDCRSQPDRTSETRTPHPKADPPLT